MHVGALIGLQFCKVHSDASIVHMNNLKAMCPRYNYCCDTSAALLS